MERVLFLSCAENDGTLSRSALEALAAAKDLSQSLQSPLSVGVFGKNISAGLASIGDCGAEKFFAAEAAALAEPRYASDAAACEALARAAAATLILAPQNSRMARVMAGVAHRLHGAIDTHIRATSVPDGQPAVSRPFYRQRMEASFLRSVRPWVLLVEPGGFAACTHPAETVTIERVPLSLPDNGIRTSVQGMLTPPANQQTIRPDAKLLFVAGAGWTKKQKDGQTHIADAEKAIQDFLKHSQASLGGSKSLVDLSGEGQAVLGFMTHLNQVGQTGATPRHPKGLSTCCHGEEPHVVGWRLINQRRAINLDPNCGWARGKADVLYVADAFEVMAKVNALLAAGAEEQPALAHD